MPLSTRTVAEYKAQAILLGRVYDEYDHSMQLRDFTHIHLGAYWLDADTLEPLYVSNSLVKFQQQVDERLALIGRGDIGPCDGRYARHKRQNRLMWVCFILTTIAYFGFLAVITLR